MKRKHPIRKSLPRTEPRLSILQQVSGFIIRREEDIRFGKTPSYNCLGQLLVKDFPPKHTCSKCNQHGHAALQDEQRQQRLPEFNLIQRPIQFVSIFFASQKKGYGGSKTHYCFFTSYNTTSQQKFIEELQTKISITPSTRGDQPKKAISHEVFSTHKRSTLSRSILHFIDLEVMLQHLNFKCSN